MKIYNNIRKSISLTILSILFFKPLFAQEIVFTASARDSVSMGEIFNIEYTLNQNSDSNTDSFNVNFFKDFQFISGPMTSFSSQISIISGKTTQNYQKIYIYELKPIAKGRFVIPEATIIVNGKKYYSNTLTIEITDTPKSQQSDSTKKITSDELYIDLSFSKQEVYVQEAITATLKLYSKYNISEISDFELPAFDDFLFYDLSDSSIIQPKTDTVNGEKFTTVILKQILLYPQKIGRLQVSGGKLKCIVRKAPKSNYIFDDFFGLSNKSIERFLESDTQAIMVKPMPEKQPADFIHICGTNLKLTATLNKTTVKANTPFVYEITLSGNGNLKLAPIPKINLPVEFKELTNSANNNLENTEDGIIGYRTFSYTIIPKQEGDFKIPEYSLSYFDRDSQQYQTVSTQPVWVNVEKSQNEPLTVKDNMLSPKEAKERTEDYDLMIVMDVSASMLAQDIIPNRLEASVNATKKFLLKQKGKVGLVIFSEDSRIKCSLMSNLKVIRDSLSTISDLDLGNGTAIGIGLGNAILELRKSNAKSKAIVLFTDGVNNLGSITPKVAARLARSFGIRIYTIGVAGKDSLASYPYKTSSGMEMIKMPVEIDEKMLKEIANNTDGKYFRAIDSNSFDDIYQEIVKLTTIKRRSDQYYSDMPKEDAERILNVISQDIEELNEKLMKK